MEPFLCDAGDWSHSIDTLAILDAPTLVDGIIAETGKQPFWIGHSMGGMVLYMYLQGVRFEGDPADCNVVSDPAVLAERHSRLKGGIAIASPPAFWWPRHHPFQVFTESSIGRGLLGISVLIYRLRHRIAPRVRLGSVAKGLVLNRPRGIKALSRSPIGIMLYNRRNTDSETSTSLVKWGAAARVRTHRPGYGQARGRGGLPAARGVDGGDSQGEGRLRMNSRAASEAASLSSCARLPSTTI